jgi:glycosyltransferase involved in cell wall biosynthesis
MVPLGMATRKSSQINKSILYVNYSPYENAGHILDYLLETYEFVFLMSLGFHSLNKSAELNKITVYKNGKIISQKYMYYMAIPQSLVYLLVPVRSAMNALQIILNIVKLRRKYGKIDIFFSVNAFTSVIGMFLQKLGLVHYTVFWVWDYYPMNFTNPIVNIMRWIYWQFDKYATLCTDKTVYLNQRLANIRISKSIIKKNTKIIKIPIATGKLYIHKKKSIEEVSLGFMGVLKKSQGLNMIFDNEHLLLHSFPRLQLHIVGSGPDEDYYRKRAKETAINYTFHGPLSDEKTSEVLSKCTVAIALYSPEDSNVSRYGDPGKVKFYLDISLPIITTNMFEFSEELEKSKAGIVIRHGDGKQLVRAMKRILNQYSKYTKNATKLHDTYYYKDLYPKMFDFSHIDSPQK